MLPLDHCDLVVADLKSFIVAVERQYDRSSDLLRLDHCLEIRQKTHVFRHVRGQNLQPDAPPRRATWLWSRTENGAAQVGLQTENQKIPLVGLRYMYEWKHDTKTTLWMICGRISYGTSETMANTDKRLSYRRETRATLCICWNVVVLLYELCYSVTGIVLYTRRCSRLNYSTASMRWSVTHTCNAEVSRTCDKQNFHHDQRCWWYRVFLRQRTVEQLYSPREVAYYK